MMLQSPKRNSTESVIHFVSPLNSASRCPTIKLSTPLSRIFSEHHTWYDQFPQCSHSVAQLLTSGFGLFGGRDRSTIHIGIGQTETSTKHVLAQLSSVHYRFEEKHSRKYSGIRTRKGRNAASTTESQVILLGQKVLLSVRFEKPPSQLQHHRGNHHQSIKGRLFYSILPDEIDVSYFLLQRAKKLPILWIERYLIHLAAFPWAKCRLYLSLRRSWLG